MIIPVNNHIIIEPLMRESFVSSKETFEEVGKIISICEGIKTSYKEGDKVFFDSWLASKYPKNETEFFWLVNIEDIKAFENV